MKKILALFLYLFFTVQVAWGWGVVGVQEAVVAGGGGTTPDWSASLDDNAATNTVIASVGSNGSLTSSSGANTQDVHSISCSEGTGCFDFSAQTGGAVRVLSPSITGAEMNDKTFTVQFSVYIPTSTTTANYVRVVNDTTTGTALLVIFPTALDRFSIYFGGASLGTFILSATLADSAWHTIRIVFDTSATNTVEVYEGADEGNLTLDASVTTALTAPANGAYLLAFAGNGTDSQCFQDINGVLDDIKIWYDAVTP